jgi:hypothetical protein
MPARRHLLLLGIAAALLVNLFLSSQMAAQNAKPTQYEVEAAYLFNFGKFVTWPEKNYPPDSFVICVLGEDPFGPILDKTTAGETVNGRKTIDKRLSRPQDARGCSILFISSSEEQRVNKILAAVEDAPMLTVSDMPGFVEHGGMIQFVVDNGRVRFKVNLAPTDQHGLALSSELLKVAVKVTRVGDQEKQ